MRELRSQGILGSLCPKEATGDESRATYGYTPVVNEIVDRLRNAITASCVPNALERDAEGNVPCLMLEVMPEGLDCVGEGRARGRALPQTDAEKSTVSAFRQRLQIPSSRHVCRLTQDTQAGSADECQRGDGGWCYLSGEAAGRCQQQIVFNDGVLGAAKGSRVYLQCISTYENPTPSSP